MRDTHKTDEQAESDGQPLEPIKVLPAAAEHLRRSEEEFKLMVAAVKDYAIFLLDPNGIISTWNEGAERINGYCEAEVVGRHFSLFHTEADKARKHLQDALEIASREGRFDEEGWRVRKDGSQFWAADTISPVKDETGELRGFVKVTRDLTERKSAEEELRQARHEAEAARDAAINASNLKSQFIANISHEIRTPMAGIIGMAEQLVRDDTLNEDQREASEHVFQSSKRLLTVLNDLLDFSKLEAGRVILYESPFSVKRMLREVIESVSVPARTKEVEVEMSYSPDLPALIIGDEDKIRQIMLNLGHNAVKFTRQGKISIVVETEDRHGDEITLRFSVHDTGIGIKSEVQPTLFQPFIQADGSTRRRFGGTGLGLSIAKRYVELMTGDIGVTSTAGVGSTFWFTIPLKVAR